MPPRKSPAAKQTRRSSSLQKAHIKFMSKELKALARAHPSKKQTELMKIASRNWKNSEERKRLMKKSSARRSPARRSPAKRSPARRSPARRSPAKRSPAKSSRRTPLQAARARFMKQKRKELQQQMPKAQPKTIQKRANNAWKKSPERKRMMAKRMK